MTTFIALFYENTSTSKFIVEGYYIIVVSQVINIYCCGVVHKAVSDHIVKKNLLTIKNF